jgi:hypothetical protein
MSGHVTTSDSSDDVELRHDDEAGPGRAEREAAAAEGADEPDLGWFAGTKQGRVVLSIVLGLLAFTLVVWNLPASEVRSQIRPTLRPVVNALAIDQRWSVFAPNPTTVSLAVEADVYLADGTVERYRFPHGDDLIGAYREYRWRKWERRVRLDSNDHLWEPTALWVAERYPAGQVDQVVLVRTFSDTPEPGSGDERVWDAAEFFTLDLVDTDGSAPEDEAVGQ